MRSNKTHKIQKSPYPRGFFALHGAGDYAVVLQRLTKNKTRRAKCCAGLLNVCLVRGEGFEPPTPAV